MRKEIRYEMQFAPRQPSGRRIWLTARKSESEVDVPALADEAEKTSSELIESRVVRIEEEVLS